ncbi:MAG: hypothetical protein H7Y43_02385 [Akkermansiaceae bacterium]|nr:hypothetical protein [Verrucomicrobiales bacterium]
MTTNRILKGTVMWLMLACAQTQAALINLVPHPNAPDFMAGFINVNYNHTTREFLAQGWTSDYVNGSVTLADLGMWTLTAQLDSNYDLAGGSLEVRGNLGAGDELLLSGSLKSGAAGEVFGFQDPVDSNHDLFEFLFTINGGNATVISDFLAWGNVGGIIVDANFSSGDIGFTGDWNQSFESFESSGVSDVFVPEPGSYGVLGAVTAFVGLVCASRRKGRSVNVPDLARG